MEQISNAIRKMIDISDEELQDFLSRVYTKTFKRKKLLSKTNTIPNEIFFINKGLLRVSVIDSEGVEHTTHFAFENEFIVDYSSFLLQEPSFCMLQVLEETTTTVLPRSAIEWGYQNLAQGEKLRRLIAEYHFICQDRRIKNTYIQTTKERYDRITEIFPNIHNRVPQHMIASYLGIDPAHLSRLKKAELSKKTIQLAF